MSEVPVFTESCKNYQFHENENTVSRLEIALIGFVSFSQIFSNAHRVSCKVNAHVPVLVLFIFFLFQVL